VGPLDEQMDTKSHYTLIKRNPIGRDLQDTFGGWRKTHLLWLLTIDENFLYCNIRTRVFEGNFRLLNTKDFLTIGGTKGIIIDYIEQ
jgi:hypothetical protein